MDLQDTIAQVLDRIDIVELISRYVHLKKSGRNLMGLCPFHSEKRPSFSVSPEKRIFKCFSCNKGGNALHFIMEYEKLEFMDALKILAKEARVTLDLKADKHADERSELFAINKEAAYFFSTKLKKESPQTLQYLTNRGYHSTVLDLFMLGYAPNDWDGLTQYLRKKKISLKKAGELGLISTSSRGNYIDRFRDRLMIPIFDLNGNICGFGGRILKADDRTAKYINSPESLIYKKSQILFGLFHSRQSIRQENRVIFVEGYFDFLQLYQAGIKNVVATSGTAFTEQHARLIKRFTDTIYLCYDSDSAGQLATLRAGLLVLNHGLEVFVILLPPGEDPDSFVKNNGADSFRQQADRAVEFSRFFLDYYSTHYDLQSFKGRQAAMADGTEILSTLNNIDLARYLVEELAFICNATPGPAIEKMNLAMNRRQRQTNKPETSGELHSETSLLPLPIEERDLIALLLLDDPTTTGTILYDISVQDFTHPTLREIYEKICAAYDDFGHIRGAAIISEITDDSVREILTQKMLDEFPDPVRYANDTVNTIHYRNAKNEIERLATQLKKAGANSKSNETLLKDYNSALSKLREARQKLAVNKDKNQPTEE